MQDTTARPQPRIDPVTVIGLVLLLSPILTMLHELAGHALACVATGHVPTQLGAYYVQCPTATGRDGRLVAMAGTGMDVLVAVLAWLLWRQVRRPLPRLASWVVMVFKAMTAAGYWMFSGVLGLGDWAPGVHGGMGVMAHPGLWRACLTVVGLVAYVAVVHGAMRGIDAMLGGGKIAGHIRVRAIVLMYVTNGAVAIAVGLLNPVGFWITLISAMASTFGGTAGLFNVAYRRKPVVPATGRAFHVGRSHALLLAGIAMTLVFGWVLGPTIMLH